MGLVDGFLLTAPLVVVRPFQPAMRKAECICQIKAKRWVSTRPPAFGAVIPPARSAVEGQMANLLPGGQQRPKWLGGRGLRR
jgi:hypothetical protein